MKKGSKNAELFVLFAMALVIVLCLLSVRTEELNQVDTAGGLNYLQGLETQDVQSLEQNLMNSAKESTENVAETSEVESTETSSEESTAMETESTEAVSEESTETETSESQEPETPAPTTQAETPAPTTPAPTTPAPTTQASTAPATTPSQTVTQNQCYVPYEVNQELLSSTLAQLDAGTLSVKSLYSNALFVGDSITSGFSLYKILNDNNVLATVGGTVYAHLPENLDAIVQYNPEILFLHYGLNEMAASESGRDNIIATYENHIRYLQERLPYTRIIVLGLGPVSDAAIQRQSRFTWIGSYNEHMRAMCERLDIGFYQNDAFFYERMHLYGSDGIHIKPQLYHEWIRDITEKMGIY